MMIPTDTNLVLLDERARLRVRDVIGRLMATSDRVDLAVARIRLATLDLNEDEVAGPRLCRVLLGQLDASTLLDAPMPPDTPAPQTGQTTQTTPGQVTHGQPAPGRAAPPMPAPALLRLRDWLASDRLEVRSAGLGAWTPDFSVYRSPSGPPICLFGAHYFGSPHLTVGPSFTAVTPSPLAANFLVGRFEELWDAAHDVAPAIMDVLDRAAGGVGSGLAP